MDFVNGIVVGIALGLKVNGWVVAIPEKLLVRETVGEEQGDADRVIDTDGVFVNGWVVGIPVVLLVSDRLIVLQGDDERVRETVGDFVNG